MSHENGKQHHHGPDPDFEVFDVPPTGPQPGPFVGVAGIWKSAVGFGLAGVMALMLLLQQLYTVPNAYDSGHRNAMELHTWQREDAAATRTALERLAKSYERQTRSQDKQAAAVEALVEELRRERLKGVKLEIE